MKKMLLIGGIAALIYGVIIALSGGFQLPSLKIITLLCGMTVLGYILKSFRWKILLNHFGYEISTVDSIKTYIAGLFFVITPGKLGEVAKAELMKEEFGFSRKKTVFIVITERAMDVLANVIIAGASGVLVARAYLSNIAFFLAIFLALLSVPFIFRKRLAFIRDELDRIGDAKLIMILLAISTIAWLIEGLEVWLAVRFLGGSIPVVAGIFAFSFSLITGNALMTPGGLGGAEAGLAGALMLFGVERAVAGSATIAVRLATLWIGFALGGVFWFILSAHNSQ